MNRRQRMLDELKQDMRDHIEQETQDNIDRGMAPDEARFAAIRKFGNRTHVEEDTREVWKMVWMEQLLQDIRFGVRLLRKSPGFTIVAVLTLALGIGANTVIFSVINGILLHPLPFHQPDRLVALSETEVAPGVFPLTGADYLDWQKQNSTLDATSLYGFGNGINASGSGEAEPALGASTQSNFFAVLGTPPMIGRTFEASSDADVKDRAVVLSYGFWKRHFAGANDAIGKTLQLDNQSFTVIGVMPANFNFPAGTDVWTAMDMSPAKLTPRGSHSYQSLARLKPGVTVKQAQADLVAIAGRLEKQFPDSNNKVSAVVTPLQEDLVGQSREPLWILLGAVALVLLVACANVANLLLARATARTREVALRAAMGASRRRIIQQSLTESLLLALSGAAIGCVGAGWFVSLARAEFGDRLPQAAAIQLDGKVLLFTMIVSTLVGIFFGMAPALRGVRLNLSDELKTSGAVVNASSKKRGLRDALVVGEIAVSLALLLGAGLLLRSFANLRNTQLGFNPENVLTARIALPEQAYPDLAARRQFYDQLLARVRQIPGVQTASVSSAIPLRGGNNGTIQIDGDMAPELAAQLVEMNNITPDFFRAYQIPFLEGRNFTADDISRTAEANLRADALTPEQTKHPPADLSFIAIVNQSLAREYWPKQDAIGKIVRFGGFPVNVVGVVGDAKEWDDLRHKPLPEMYFPLTLGLDSGRPGYLSVKTAAAPLSMAGTLRSELKQQDSRLALFRVRSMEQVIAESMRDTTVQTVLLASFAGLALLLAAIGIYGVMAYAVSQREHEFGIRMALGSPPSRVSRMVLSNGLRLALVGVAIGLVAALALARFMSSLVFGVSVWDPIAFFGASLVLIAVALTACYIPARRAMRVDPMIALRHE